MNGNPVPYLMMNDSWIGILIILCFMTSCYVLARGKKHLLQEIKETFDSRPLRSSTLSISQTTSEDIRFHLVFEVQLCLFIALLFFGYTSNGQFAATGGHQFLIYISIFTGIILLGSVFKVIIYLIIGWVFFDKTVTKSWIRCYFVTDVILEFILFPLLLIVIYRDISSQIYIPIAIFLLILAKSLLFFRGIKLFFLNPYRKIYFIAYLCALELIPLIFIWGGLSKANDFLQLNF